MTILNELLYRNNNTFVDSQNASFNSKLLYCNTTAQLDQYHLWYT